MSPTYKSFAIAGAGGYGTFVAQHLAANPAVSIRVLSRSQDAKVPQGVEVVVVDYNSKSSVEKALDGIEVVISTLFGEGIGHQDTLAKDAKLQGVKLFVPSEFGNDTSLYPEGPLSWKFKTQELLREIGLPYVAVYNGMFTDFIFVPFAGFDFANKSVSVVGKGDTPNSFTTRSDSARFVAHALTTFEPASLNNLELRIEGDKRTFNEVIRIYEDTHPGVKINVKHEDVSAVKENLGPSPGPEKILDYLKVTWEEGGANVGKKSGTSNHLWEDWKPSNVKDFIAGV